MEEDPIAQKHLAKLSKFRGEYDEWGNRLTRSMLNTRHLLERPEQNQARKSRGTKKKLQDDNANKQTNQIDLTEYNFSEIFNILIFIINLCFSEHPAELTLSPPPRFKTIERRESPEYEEKTKVKKNYRERYDLEHTYTAQQGERLYKQRGERLSIHL